MPGLPIIDVDDLRGEGPAADAVARQIDSACREIGFFLIRGATLPHDLLAELDRMARRFFALPDPVKGTVAMARGGRAWRGWFPEGGELTSGRPDRKEGLYLGLDLAPDHPRVRARTPLHGPNLLPDEALPGFRAVIDRWIGEMHRIGALLLTGIARGLGLEPGWFETHLTADPTMLLRIFRYPAPADDAGWGVAEHTDYGLLTILAHDGRSGLQVRTPAGWIDVPAAEDTFVVNIGDMLERLTGGRYRSTPHRVQRDPGDADRRDRLSFPFFFDPGWDVEVVSPFGPDGSGDGEIDRWDGADPRLFEGTYGDYLLDKVGKVFPELGARVLDEAAEDDGASPSAGGEEA